MKKIVFTFLVLLSFCVLTVGCSNKVSGKIYEISAESYISFKNDKTFILADSGEKLEGEYLLEDSKITLNLAENSIVGILSDDEKNIKIGDFIFKLK